MKTFRYVASSSERATIRGSVPAEDADAAAAMLRQQGLLPIRLRETTHRSASVSLGDLATFMRGVCTLVQAGIPVDAALSSQERVPKLRAVARQVRHTLHEGQGLSAAFQQLGAPAEVVGVVKAGEQSDLDTALGSAAHLLERRIAVRRELAAALAYPGVLIAVGSAAIVTLVVQILPRFTELLTDTGSSLPAATTALMSLSGFLRDGWPWIVISVLGMGAALRIWLKTSAGHAVLLGLPIAGEIRFRLATARIASTLSVLLEQGAPALAAIAAARDACGDLAVTHRLGEALHRVRDGFPMSSAFEEHAALTRESIMLMRIGEDSGRVPDLLKRAAAIDEERAMSSIKALTRMVEPILVVCLGAVVGFVALAILQAMYGIRTGL
jgi:type II secretory pathway component PulF